MTLTTPTADDLATLEAIAGGGLASESPDAARYFEEPRGLFRGGAAAILRPATTEAVAVIVRHCNARRIGIIPYGGGTGLVGGQVAALSPPAVLLSLERMNRIREVRTGESALVAEAGVTLAAAQEAAEAAGRLFPLSLASEGSCQVGGNLATNAGGTQVLRYGNARDLCLGVEAVLADGSVLKGPSTLRKDNTGYDLRNLLIGSEGTLGIITAAALRLFPRPRQTVTAMLTVPGPEEAVALLHHMQDRLGDTVTTFEILNGTGPEFLAEHFPEITDPLDGAPPWRVMMEAGSGAQGDLAEACETAFGEAFEAGLATDGVIAASEAQRAHMWHIRETIPEANRRVGVVSSHDISVPVSRIPAFIAEADRAVAAVVEGLRINCFGHLGDGNLHYNVFPPKGRSRDDFRNVRVAIKDAVYDLVAKHGGSFSAEHGLGRLKLEDLTRHGDPAKIAAMRAIKAAMDPNGILNPGAVVPAP